MKIPRRHIKNNVNLVQSREFTIPDYNEVMAETKNLSNAEIMKNFSDLKKLGTMKYNKKLDVLPPPDDPDSDYYNFYMLNVVNNTEDLPPTFLGQAISGKIGSKYTHTFISLDKHMKTPLGFLTQGLVRELPEYYGYQAFKYKAKRDYDVFKFKITPSEYKKGRQFFSNMMTSMSKYSYDFLGLAKPLIYKLNEDKLPTTNIKKTSQKDDIHDYHKKTAFICSSFALYALTYISAEADTWYNMIKNKVNMVTSCFNPASMSNIPGMEFAFNVNPKRTYEECLEEYEKKNGLMPN